MDKSRKFRKWLGIVLVMVLILLIPLVVASCATKPTPVASAGAVPYEPPTETPMETPTLALPTTATPSATNGVEPPACTFPLAQTTTAVSAPESYTFSEPKMVPIDPSLGDIDIFQWLPDNQRVLIERENVAPRPTGYSIQLFNPQTGKTQDFVSRLGSSFQGPPVWVAGLNAVVHPETLDLTPVTIDKNGMPIFPPSSNYSRQLLLSRGNPANVQPIEDAQVTISNDHRPTVGAFFTTAVNSNGSQIVYMDGDTQLYERKVVQGTLETVQPPSFDATKWDYRRPGNAILPMFFQMAWRPNSTQILLYSDIETGGYTFLLDVQSGQICELNLFGKQDPTDWQQMSSAMMAYWSPNGHYLAIVRMKGPFPIDFNDLIVLDTATGKLYQTDAIKLSPAGLESQDKHFITDVAWSPDSRHLAAIGRVDYSLTYGNSLQGGNSFQTEARLFLLDFLTNQSIQVSSAEFAYGLDLKAHQLLWSNDGSQLIALCQSGLCLLSVQQKIQP